jgi:CubicO group peptidase (beta-lactamase class C family)
MALALCCSLASLTAAAGDSDTPDRIDALVRHVMKKAQVPGMSVLVATGNDILLAKGYGMADIEHSARVDPDTVFAIGSATKQFTCLAVAQLISGGRMSLDDSIRRYVPELPEFDDPIAIRHLLNHTSGIFNYTQDRELHRRVDERHSHTDMLAWFKDIPPAFPPGDRWDYTNSGTYLLGMAIEKASGLSYGEYLQRHIFSPFGLQHTYYGDSFSLVPGRARGYDVTESGKVTHARDYDASVPFSAGALLSTTRDLFAYLRAVYAGEKVSEEIRSLLLTRANFAGGETIDYALGCILISQFEGHGKYSHSGEIYGYHSQVAYYPDDQLTIIVLSNRTSYLPSPVSLERKIARIMLDEDEPDNRTQLVDLDRDALLGTYNTGRLTLFSKSAMTLWFQEDTLLLAFGEEAREEGSWRFRYVGAGRFVLVDDDEISIDFSDAPTLSVFDITIRMHRKQP